MIPLDAAADLPPKHKQQLLEVIEQMQIKDGLKSYNNVVEKCFIECVHDFRQAELEPGEQKCLTKCYEKFSKNTQRIGTRFAEFAAEKERELAGEMAQMQK